MEIVDNNFDNSVINGMAIQFGIYIGILVIAIIVLIILFKMLRIPRKIAGTLASLIFLIIAYYVFKLVISWW